MSRDKSTITGMQIFNKYFSKQYPEMKYKQFGEFCKEAFVEIDNYLLNGNWIDLPYDVGAVYLRKNRKDISSLKRGKIKTLSTIDWGETRKLRLKTQPTWKDADWKLVPKENRCYMYRDNEHSDDYIYRFKYKPGKLRTRFFIRFRPTRYELNRKLAMLLKTGQFNGIAFEV